MDQKPKIRAKTIKLFWKKNKGIILYDLGFGIY